MKLKTRIILVLALVANVSFGQYEYLKPLGFNSEIEPTVRLKKMANSFDSTFIYTTDTLSLPFFDEFSKNRFQQYVAQPGDLGVTEEQHFALLDLSSTPLSSSALFSTVQTYRIEIDTTNKTTTNVPLAGIDIKLGNLQFYPPTYATQTVYPPYDLIDTLDFVNDLDTVWKLEDLAKQDSAIQFFAQINDPNGLWLDHYAYHNYRFAKNPWSLGVATFDGLDENGFPYNFGSAAVGYADVLTSKPLRLNGYVGQDSLYFSFLYQCQGLGDAPESSDSLVLEFYAPLADQWFRVWSTEGQALSDFKVVHFPVKDVKYLKKGFQFRFRNYGALSGDLDHFHIDYVSLKALSGYQDTLFKDFAFVYPIGSMLKEYTAVPWDHYKNNPTDKMNDQFRVSVRNGSNIQENSQNGDARISYNGTQEASFSLSNFILTNQDAGQNYSPRTVYESFHDFSLTGSRFDETKIGDQQFFDIGATVSAQFPNFPQNDSTFGEQVFKNYYAYDDGSAEKAYGIIGLQARLAYQFTPYEADSLIGVQMYFSPSVNNVSNNLFLLSVWGDNNGAPGELLYQDDFFYTRQPTYLGGRNKFVTYFFKDTAKLRVDGTFYVGWRQLDEDRLNIGFDANLDNHGKIFYSLDNGNSWVNSQFAGSIMMRPLFSTALDASLGVKTIAPKEPNFTVFPNPTSDLISIESTNVDSEFTLYNLQGKVVLQIPAGVKTIDLSTFQAGIYIIQDLTNGKSQKIIKK